MEHPRRNILQGLSAAIVIAVAGAVAGLSPALAAELTVTSWGGAYEESQVKAFHEPFAKATGVKVIKDVWDGSVAKIRAMVETKTYSWDVIDVEPAHALQGCDEGFFERIDYGVVGTRTNFIPGGAMDCAAGTIVWSTVYAYDPAKFPGAKPKTMADFWDVKKFPGPRSMRKVPQTNLEFALIADGVPTSKVYDVLRTPAGVERAFKKLGALKPHIKVWWTAGAQPPQLLADGEVAMVTAWNGRIYNAVKKEGKNFVIVWDGQAMDFNLWAIPKGNPRKDLAMKFIAFSMRPEIMGQQSRYISYAPTVKAAIKYVAPAVLPDMPTAPENTRNAFAVDPLFWADHGEELTARFNAWLAK